MLQRATVVTMGREPRSLDHLGDLPADHGNVLDAVAEDVGGVEPEHPQLAVDGPAGIEAAHGDGIERHVAVDGGSRPSLG